MTPFSTSRQQSSIATGSVRDEALHTEPVFEPEADVLNPEQVEAVRQLDGPILVLAGAGTGKTRVLIHRIAHILATNSCQPSQILAVTFTNKASQEMKTRIRGIVGAAIEGMPWLGTFHSIGAKLLRIHAELAGLKPDFTILDTNDQLRLIKQVMSAASIDEKRWPHRSLLWRIDAWKNRALEPDDLTGDSDDGFAGGFAPTLYKAYQTRLLQLNAVDFGDLLLKGLVLLRTHADILSGYQNRFRHILVDEYQDTNVVQYLWLRLLAGTHNPNICCVGDDDQSIYGWRGAEVSNILRFDVDFPGAKIIRLETNYRSTPSILATASKLISFNEGRLGKNLRTHIQEGELVTVAGSWDSSEEARSIQEEIENQTTGGADFRDIAILVRASYQMREFEERFVATGLPYRVIGGPRFYERREVSDIVAFLRLIRQPTDDLAFERIVNVPRRGIGEATIQKLHRYARQKTVSLVEAAIDLRASGEIAGRSASSLTRFLLLIDRFRERAGQMAPFQLAEIVIDETGYSDMLKADTAPDAHGRLENLKELIRALESFDTLTGFLEHIALVMEISNGNIDSRVSLMTLHAAKGLEFDTVFLPGWEEGLFPHQKSLDETGNRGLEEERRLAYVGITRAKRLAFIWFANSRRVHGMWKDSVPSRFLDELPREHLNIRRMPARAWHGQTMRNQPSRGYERVPVSHEVAADRPHNSSTQTFGLMKPDSHGSRNVDSDGDTENIQPQVGDRVFHQKFGPGTVADQSDDRLSVCFDHAGTKRIVARFVRPI